ncbi:SdpI family protein [Mesonia aquimarina]|uniref:SdpI family protein n=1 Tax=Mesonia aquimarina TaxID=1504967 RepID=UPI000EF5A942|nr:SdpI family protein [Mesonia aquimarina]
MGIDFFLSPLFLSGFVFVLLGFIMYKFPPKEINSLYGYRTSKSMESQEKWDFSQRHSAVLLIKTGIIFCLISLLIFFINVSNEVLIIAETLVILIGAVLLIIITERAIKNKFEK